LVHFYKKAPTRNKITHKPCKTIERTLDLKPKCDPILELVLRFRRGRQQRPPHSRRWRGGDDRRNSGSGALHH
jgi:hypothetical protein